MSGFVFLLLALALVGVGVVLGALLLNANRDREPYDARTAQAWRSLQAVNRLNAAFWAAREAMQREAVRQQFRIGTPPPDSTEFRR